MITPASDMKNQNVDCTGVRQRSKVAEEEITDTASTPAPVHKNMRSARPLAPASPHWNTSDQRRATTCC